MKPKQTSRAGGIKAGKTSIIETAEPSSSNLNPYNRKKK